MTQPRWRERSSKTTIYWSEDDQELRAWAERKAKEERRSLNSWLMALIARERQKQEKAQSD